MRVTVEEGRLRRIEAHEGNRATDTAPCLKGLAYVERVSSPDRLLHPLERRSDGSFERVTWERALARIQAHLERYRAEPQSVLYYAGSGTKGLLNAVGASFWRRYGGYTTTYGDLCWMAGLEASRLTLGSNEHNAPWDLENARTIVLWGKNSAETNIHQMPHVDRALERGARLVVVDPRRTQTAERAHLHVAPRPGSDGALALALGNLLVERGAVDRAFVDRHVHGFEEYVARCRTYSVDRAAAICALEPAVIERFVGILCDGAPITIAAGFGMQRYTNGGQTMRAMIALLAITGNVGKRGAGWQFANLQSHVFGARDPVASYPPQRPDGIARVSVSTTKLGEHMLAQRDPPLRMAWVERGNPLSQNPDTQRVREAFRALEFVVCVDQFLTDTAREAHLVLPAKTMFEQDDVIAAYWHPYVQLRQKVLEPPGDVLPETTIYRTLAERLGFDGHAIAEDLPRSDEELRAYLERRLAPFPELSLERLREGPVLAPGAREVAFENLRFETPSGRIELASEQARELWNVDLLPSHEEPVESTRNASRAGALSLLTPNTKNRIHSQFGNLAMIRQVSEPPAVTMHPADAEERGLYSGHVVRVWNDRGAFHVPLALDFGIKRGCVSVTNGFWNAEGASVNLCSASRETDMGFGAAFHDDVVWVEAVS